jgi:hypothetical protein
MKTINEIARMVRSSRLGLATVLIGVFATVTTANAQYKPTGYDGITASPRLRAQLDERKTTTTADSATVPSMACARCKDAWFAKADTSPKGAGARTLMGQTTKSVVQHLCGGCGSEWTTAGSGKAKLAVATHKCSSCGAENLACCAPKGASDVATKGMGEKFQVAPIK